MGQTQPPRSYFRQIRANYIDESTLSIQETLHMTFSASHVSISGIVHRWVQYHYCCLGIVLYVQHKSYQNITHLTSYTLQTVYDEHHSPLSSFQHTSARHPTSRSENTSQVPLRHSTGRNPIHRSSDHHRSQPDPSNFALVYHVGFPFSIWLRFLDLIEVLIGKDAARTVQLFLIASETL